MLNMDPDERPSAKRILEVRKNRLKSDHGDHR